MQSSLVDYSIIWFKNKNQGKMSPEEDTNGCLKGGEGQGWGQGSLAMMPVSFKKKHTQAWYNIGDPLQEDVMRCHATGLFP